MENAAESLKPRQHLLRWRFDYSGNRPAKYGIWSRPGETPEVQAWCQNKEGLVRASVEAKDIFTREVRTLAECDGWDFITFQWIAVASLPAIFRGTVTPLTRVVGLKMVTRETALEVYDTGDVRVAARTDGDKQLNLATFGK